MNPSRTFIHRPIATSLLMIALFLSGVMAYKWLPVSALPEIDYPTIQVVTFYPGAGPEVMTSLITAPLERQFGQMPGLKQMTSTSSEGSSIIVLQFVLELNLDVAEQSVQAAINAASNLLPMDLPSPPVYNKVNPADPPVITLAITSKTILMPKVEDLVDTRLAQKISQLSGVGLVSLSGGQRPAIRVQANMRALASYDLSLEDLNNVISRSNVNQPKGSLNNDERTYTIDANDQIKSAEDYRNLIVGYNDDRAIRLAQVAEVTESVENTRLAAWAGFSNTPGQTPDLAPAIILNVYRQPGANVIEVADNIKELLPRIQAALPQAVEVHVLTDRTVSIRASISAVQTELFISIVLVIMVMYLFLRNMPATIIPSVAVPLSLVGTFGLMYLAGFSINNLTLMAMTIATGFVVDDAIVVIENISRYLEKGQDPYHAALKGSEQIGFTIISLTFSLVAVLIPLLFMTEVIGRLFREFAVTLAVAILLSAVVSLTLTPMMCAFMLRQQPRIKKEKDHFARLVAFYDRCLKVVLEHQPLTLLITGLTLLLTFLLAVFIPKGLFPVQDTGVVQAFTQAPQSISFQSMCERQEALAKMILQDQDVESLSSFIGVDGINTTLSSGRMIINLKPLGERSSRVQEIIARLKERAASVAGVDIYLQLVQDLTIEDRLSRTQYQFTLEAIQLEDLSHWVPRLIERLAEKDALTDLAHDLQDKGLKAYLLVDRDSASRLGVSMSDIGNALYNAFGQRFISTIFTQSNQYRIILEVQTMPGQGANFLDNVYVPSSNGHQIPLGTMARVEERSAYMAINRQSQFPSATISFNLAPGASLGQAVKEITEAETELGLPDSIHTSFSGAALVFQDSLSSQAWLIIAAVVTMYIVLGILYESAIHPITILSTLPSAGVGALIALLLFRMDMGLVGIIGIILLIGIVKKNAIMMIDFALEAERQERKTPREAIHQACLLRLRPILMTTMAALLGAVPLMLGRGMGAELRQPLGVVLVGGLLLSQILTLFTTPVIYLAIDRLGMRLRGIKKSENRAEGQ